MKFPLLFSFILISFAAKSQTISLDSAQYFAGKTVSVCGKVQGIYKSKKEAIFINFGKPYPNNTFTAVIFPTSLKDFYYNPKDSLNNLDICITGEVKMYNGKAEIIVSKPNQITANKK